jgi:hypothetical protein
MIMSGSRWAKVCTPVVLGVAVVLTLVGPTIPGCAETGTVQDGSSRRVHVPHFDDTITWRDTAIFWFGRINASENYADVRVAYTDDDLCLRLQVFDRRVWYDTSPTPNDLTEWDAATMFLDLDGNVGDAPDANSYQFVAQFNWWEARDDYQLAYQGTGSGWQAVAFPFTTSSAWRGDAPNTDDDDRGWVAEFCLPFDSFELSGPPAQGTVWGLGLILHDRDDAAGTFIPDKMWPDGLESADPATWGQLAFGLPTYSPPATVPGGTVTIRQGLDGAVVVDGAVGGAGTCGRGLDFWNEWGDTNYAGSGDFNIQNQSDVADWPCYSKYYVIFPLDALPAGRTIVSATLTLHQYGNAGGGSWGDPPTSYIQVLTVAEDWNEETLTWNNAPLAVKNVSGAHVPGLTSFPGWPGVPRNWDLGLAVAEAHAAAEPLRLVLYSADTAYHSGKYFSSSDTGNWNAVGRPTLRVTWGDALATVGKEASPTCPSAGDIVTYTLTLLGNSRALTLTDDLPAEVSAPGLIQVSGGGTAAYDSGSHRLSWNGSPSSGQAVTITFPVTISTRGPLAVRNTAALTDADGFVSTDEAVVVVEPEWTYLPAVLQGW